MSDELRPIAKSTAQAICDAVKAKEGTTEGIPFNLTLADRISALPSGVNKLPQLLNNTITEITAEDLEGVKYIPAELCGGKTSLTSVTISDSVVTLADKVFYNCRNLKDVTIGNNVQSIGTNAFSYADIRNSLTIPNSVTAIGKSAFAYNKNLPSVVINSSIIGVEMFYQGHAITDVTISNNVTSIGDSAFFQCRGLTNITIPDSVTSVGNGICSSCTALTSITVGNGLTSIHKGAFNYLEKLMNFTIASPIFTDIGFVHSTKLTIDSLKNIINALADYSGTENDSKYKLTLNSTCNATLEAEGATAPDGLTWKEYVWAKGWNLA